MIQRLALNQFTLTAIVISANPENTTAMMDSGGKSYLVKKGSKIGPNNGYVREITETKVIVEEPELSYLGDRRARITEFKLNVLEPETDESGSIVDDESA
jgi:type IV pilus assembly protein PilP